MAKYLLNDLRCEGDEVFVLGDKYFGSRRVVLDTAGGGLMVRRTAIHIK